MAQPSLGTLSGQALVQRPGVQPGFCTSQVFPGDARDGKAEWEATSKGAGVLQFDGYLFWGVGWIE